MRVLRHHKATLYVWRNIQLVKSRVILFFLLLVTAFLLFAMDVFPYSSVGLLMVPLAYLLGVYSYKSYQTWQVGSLGEEQVASVLMQLPDNYILVNGPVIPPNRGDIDHVVVGCNGIFVVESKNYSGRISCDGDEWAKIKVGKGGKAYNLRIGSPSNQVKRNAKVLKDFIIDHKKQIFEDKAPHLWIHGIVVFTNPDAEVELKNPTVDVVELDMLCEHILKATSNSDLTQKQVDAIGETILKYAG